MNFDMDLEDVTPQPETPIELPTVTIKGHKKRKNDISYRVETLTYLYQAPCLRQLP